MNYGVSAASIAEVEFPSQLILVFEKNSANDFGYSWAPADLSFTNHLGTTNFLFGDGHVKALKPTATLNPTNMWNVSQGRPTNSNLANKLQSEQAKM